MNSMTNTFIAHTTQLANQYLDNFPIQEVEDFNRIKVALEILLEKNELAETKAEIKQQVSLIKEVIDAPEMYAKPEQCDQFKRIVLARAAAKIKEIECLSPEGKKRYLELTNERNEVVGNNHEIMKTAAPRDQGPLDYTLTPEELVDFSEGLEALRNLNAQRPRDEVDTVLNVNHELNYPPTNPVSYVFFDSQHATNVDNLYLLQEVRIDANRIFSGRAFYRF